MSFFSSDQTMIAHLQDLINKFSKDGRPNLHQNISITWIRYEKPNQSIGVGASWAPKKLFYPASVVKLIYGIATESWLQKDFIQDSPELRRALFNMISKSSNDATSYILDVLTGTNSGEELLENKWEAWKKQRHIINQWLQSFNWPEFNRVNCCQKTWTDGPYGRDKEFYGKNNENRNALSTSSVARIFEALMQNKLLTPANSKYLKTCLSRSLDLLERKNDPENQIDGFIGAGLPQESKLWSKAGWMSEVRHDAAWCQEQGQSPMLLVIFSQGKELSNDSYLFPSLAAELNTIHKNMSF